MCSRSIYSRSHVPGCCSTQENEVVHTYLKQKRITRLVTRSKINLGLGEKLDFNRLKRDIALFNQPRVRTREKFPYRSSRNLDSVQTFSFLSCINRGEKENRVNFFHSRIVSDSILHRIYFSFSPSFLPFFLSFFELFASRASNIPTNRMIGGDR